MTSRHEAFGNVYSEAAAFGCYIISTDVGGAVLASNNWNFGACVDQEDSKGLSAILADLVNGKLKVDTSNSVSPQKLYYSNTISNILIPQMN